MAQNRESGAAARKAGLEIAASIAQRIGAKKLNPNSNEFDWNGQQITLRIAREKNNLVGVTHAMIERVKAVIGAFEVSSNEYELLSISPEVFKRHMRDSKGDGKVFLVPETIFRKQGTVVAKVNISAANLNLTPTQTQLESEAAFDVSSLEEAKEKVLCSIVLRRGQRKFRDALLDAYSGACAVTGTMVEDILEAAHIAGYRGEGTNHIGNGLLLRADIHALFDLGLLSIDPSNFSVYCSQRIRSEPAYKDLHGKKIGVPVKEAHRPDRVVLREHFNRRIN